MVVPPGRRIATWRSARWPGPERRAGRAAQGPFVGSFAGHLEDCRSDLEYCVEAGELESPTYRVRVIQPLTIARFEADRHAPFLHPPAGRPSTHDGNLRVVEGSSVQFAIDLNREPGSPPSHWVQLDDPSRTTVPLEIQGTRLSGTLPTVSADQVLRDRRRSRRWRGPGPREVSHPGPARRASLGEASSGPRRSSPSSPRRRSPSRSRPATISAWPGSASPYRVGNGPRGVALASRPCRANPSPRALTMLYLEKHKLTYTDNITYHAFVEDNRPDAAAPRGFRASIHRHPAVQAGLPVCGRWGNVKRQLSNLEELIARQRSVLNRTFLHEHDTPASRSWCRRPPRSSGGDFRCHRTILPGARPAWSACPVLDEAVASMGKASRLW